MSTTVVNIKWTDVPAYVYIGRPTPFGNPFTHTPLKDTVAEIQVATRDEAVQAYKDWLAGTAYKDFRQDQRKRILDSVSSLKGYALGCYCKPAKCHGDVLAELADAEV